MGWSAGRHVDHPCVERGEKTPTPKISALLRKRPVLLKANFVLIEDQNGLTTDIFVVKYTGRGLVAKRAGVLSKVQMLNLVLGVGVFSFLANVGGNFRHGLLEKSTEKKSDASDFSHSLRLLLINPSP